MKEDIINNIDNPRELERLYRTNKFGFRKEFNSLETEVKRNKIFDFWNERLNYESPEISWGSARELVFIIFASLLAGVIAKIPAYYPVEEQFFYTRNVGFIVFPILMAYFAWKNRLRLKKIILPSAVIIISLVFINLLPNNNTSDTLKLSCIFLPLVLWSSLGYVFTGNELNSTEKRFDYLRFNGDLIVITAILMIAGGILTAITHGLFQLIGYNIEEFYMKYIAIFGVSAIPIIGTYVIQKNPELVNKVSPVVAKIFSPLVLMTLIVYLIAIIVSGKDPYNDRQFLLTFNGLLILVMAIIVFSIAETSRPKSKPAETIILFCLSIVTILVNGIALSAILFRISEWGITPNRLVVLVSNLLILVNLLMVTYKLFRVMIRKGSLEEVDKTISSFLPVYTVWSLIVLFLLPFVFGFR